MSSERIFQAIAIARYANEIGADAIAHGSTGAGNDQIRFDMTFLVMAPGVEIITLTRDRNLTRKEEVDYLVHLVDELGIPVMCYGLRADFKGDLFPGSEALLVMADKLEEVKTVCWCGRKAAFNARFDRDGRVLKEGAQVVLGANDQYIGLCRRHWMAGDMGPDFQVTGR